MAKLKRPVPQQQIVDDEPEGWQEKPAQSYSPPPPVRKPEPVAEPEPEVEIEIEPVPQPVIEHPKVTMTAVSKTDAIRQAVAAGYSKPKEGVEWIKQQFDLDVSTGTFSTTKNGFNKKQNVVVRTQATSPVRVTRQASAISRPQPSGDTISVELLKAVKHLVATYGSHRVIEVAELLAD